VCGSGVQTPSFIALPPFDARPSRSSGHYSEPVNLS